MTGVNSRSTISINSGQIKGKSSLENFHLEYIWNLLAQKGELKAMAISRTILEEIGLWFILAGFFAAIGFVCVSLFMWRRSSNESEETYQQVEQVRKDVVEEVEEPKKTVTIVFGSQTGTAEGFAKAFAEEGRARYENKVAFRVVNLEEYGDGDEEFEKKLGKESLIVQFLATCGDGEPTDNMACFYKWFTETIQADQSREPLFAFSRVPYAIFGLGNRQYEHFNKCALLVDACMEKEGGQRLIDCGIGDDDQCIEDDFDAWREQLWPKLDALLHDGDLVKDLSGTGTASITQLDSMKEHYSILSPLYGGSSYNGPAFLEKITGNSTIVAGSKISDDRHWVNSTSTAAGSWSGTKVFVNSPIPVVLICNA